MTLRRHGRPAATGTAAAGVTRRLQAADGVLIHAEHLRSGGADPKAMCVVIAHGFTQNSAGPRIRRIASWIGAEAGVLLVDLRGHGRSGGRSTVGRDEIHDIDAAASWAFSLGYRRVVTLGFSLGAAVVLRHAAIRGGVDAVAAVSAPGQWFYRGSANMRTLHRLVLTRAGRSVLRVVRRTRVSARPWTEPFPLDPRGAAAAVDVPLLVVHGDLDDYFPAHHAWGLHRAAPAGTLWMERGFGHAEAAVSEDLARRIGAWLAVRSGARPPAASATGLFSQEGS